MGIEHFIKDGSLLKVLEESGVRTIMVMGGSDTGKTTLVHALLSSLSGPRAIVDLDMGQSQIGVPTTVSWGKVSGSFGGLGDIKEEGFYFTGALSPPGNLLPSLVGARRLVDRAREASHRIVIDTTGLIDEPTGRVLKRYKIDLLLPDIIIGLERNNELSHILDPLRFQRKPVIWRVPVPDGVRMKSRAKRMEWRTERFREYFKTARPVEVLLEETGVEFTREAGFQGLEGRVVSLRNAFNEDMSLGVIEKTDLRKKRLVLRTPADPLLKWRTIVIGSATINNL